MFLLYTYRQDIYLHPSFPPSLLHPYLGQHSLWKVFRLQERHFFSSTFCLPPLSWNNITLFLHPYRKGFFQMTLPTNCPIPLSPLSPNPHSSTQDFLIWSQEQHIWRTYRFGHLWRFSVGIFLARLAILRCNSARMPDCFRALPTHLPSQPPPPISRTCCNLFDIVCVLQSFSEITKKNCTSPEAVSSSYYEYPSV